MPFYADLSPRRTRQIAGDAVVAGVVLTAVVVAVQVRGLVLALQEPGRRLVDAGSGLRGALDGAAEAASRIPVVGDGLSRPLGDGAATGQDLVDAGEAQIALVGAVASWLAFLIVAVPVLVLMVTWLPLRLRYVARSGAVRRLEATGQADLLALRALTSLAPAALSRVTRGVAGDPAGAWRRGDPVTIAALADAELRMHGLRPRPTAVAPVGRPGGDG